MTGDVRILLDTNIFMIGSLNLESVEAKLLSMLVNSDRAFIIILSNELEDEIRRVGRRLQDKDWVGQLINRLWHTYRLEYVYISRELIDETFRATTIPKEDIGIYLTALLGQVDYFISANRELLREAAKAQKQFECLNAEEFVTKFSAS